MVYDSGEHIRSGGRAAPWVFEADGPLVGREADLDRIGVFLEGVARAGGPLLLLGEPGVGKTALLAAAASRARACGMDVVAAAGVEYRARLSYSGLGQLLDAMVDRRRGERLRRGRAPAQARRHLTAAAEIFDRLGAIPWADRARQELRACGGPARTLTRPEAAALTPQQREIAGLAAAGLSNKQIAERFFRSPRTVSTHLYQAFPKLGVPSRAALRDALEELDRR